MASSEGGETITDIHNYLTSFNKEIQTGSQGGASKNVTQVFIDESGQYFYHTVDGQEMVLMETSPQKADPSESLDLKAIKSPNSPLNCQSPPAINMHYDQEEPEMVDPPVTVDSGTSLQVLPAIADQAASNQVILNSGESNQIVTLVPSTNAGEVSYVLIVEQASESGKDDTVYDFNEADESLTYINKDAPEEEKKIVRILPKKSQIITPVHMCNYCNYTSPKRYLLSRHMRSHSEERPHKCSVCERGFKTLASLQNHVNTHTGIKPHRCKLCASTFTTSGELVRHVRYIHTHEKPHKCPDCDYASVELSKLKRHMRCHTGERPYQCPHCTYASPDTFKLKRHIRIHTGEKPYECEVCNAKFTQSNSLKAHKLIHTGNKPIYACELCPTTCGRKTDLRIHIQKLHISDKPIKCKKCGKAFPDRYTFKQHNKTHEGEKCFKCDLCSYASSSARHLESHMLIHTERKPYVCEDCNQAFRQKQLLKRHQNLYHNPCYIPPIPKEKNQECAECGKTFRHKGNLLRHMIIHDPESSSLPVKPHSFRISRQKRIQLIDGQEVEVLSGDVDEEEMMTVEGQDGNQYVVLEVIQLQDTEGVMMSDGLSVGAEPSLDCSSVSDALSPSMIVPHPLTSDTPLDSHNLLELPTNSTEKKTLKVNLAAASAEAKKDARREMETCFGFDEDDDGTQIRLEFGE